MDNSDSPSIVEQLSQGPSFCYNTFISDSFLALCLTGFPLALLLSPLGLPLAEILPLYLGYSPIELWDSLSGYAYPGIACLAFQASAWLGAFWASLSGYSSRCDPC